MVPSAYQSVCPLRIRGAHGTACENRCESQCRPGAAGSIAHSPRTACRTSAPSWEQPVRGTRKRLKNPRQQRVKTPKPPHRPHSRCGGFFFWAESRLAALSAEGGGDEFVGRRAKSVVFARVPDSRRRFQRGCWAKH